MANKKVEGLWVVTAIRHYSWMGEGSESRDKSRVATTKQGLKTSIQAASQLDPIRVEVEEYSLGEMTKYNAEI